MKLYNMGKLMFIGTGEFIYKRTQAKINLIYFYECEIALSRMQAKSLLLRFFIAPRFYSMNTSVAKGQILELVIM